MQILMEMVLQIDHIRTPTHQPMHVTLSMMMQISLTQCQSPKCSPSELQTRDSIVVGIVVVLGQQRSVPSTRQILFQTTVGFGINIACCAMQISISILPS